MVLMRRSLIAVAATAMFLTACGGSDDSASTTPTYSAVISFGDSLSDVGTFQAFTSVTGNLQAPYFGGKFTVNGDASGGVWVEEVAKALGQNITPQRMVNGFAADGSATYQLCPASAGSSAPTAASTCFGYAEGGAQVSVNGSVSGLPVVIRSVKDQVAAHVSQYARFKADELVLLQGGNNDVFKALDEFGTLAATLGAQVQQGQLTVDEMNTQLQAKQAEGLGKATQAAKDLAAIVKNQLLASGAKHVVVENLPDSSTTPFITAQGASAQQYVAALVGQFNSTLKAELTGTDVLLFDVEALFKQVLANPAAYGFTNTTGEICNLTTIRTITGKSTLSDSGSSLFCDGRPGSPTNGLTANASSSTWLFADGLHPSLGMHKLTATKALEAIRAKGW